MQTLDWGQSLRNSGNGGVAAAEVAPKERESPAAGGLPGAVEFGLEGGRERRRGRRAALLGWWGGEVPGIGAVGAGAGRPAGRGPDAWDDRRGGIRTRAKFGWQAVPGRG
jgi:hypothetical protein